MSEIFSLTWSNVDIEQGIAIVTNDNAKSDKAHSLLLNNEVLRLISSITRSSDYVFTREMNKRNYDIARRDFKKALTLSNIENFRLHDLRHT